MRVGSVKTNVDFWDGSTWRKMNNKFKLYFQMLEPHTANHMRHDARTIRTHFWNRCTAILAMTECSLGVREEKQYDFGPQSNVSNSNYSLLARISAKNYLIVCTASSSMCAFYDKFIDFNQINMFSKKIISIGHHRQFVFDKFDKMCAIRFSELLSQDIFYLFLVSQYLPATHLKGIQRV